MMVVLVRPLYRLQKQSYREGGGVCENVCSLYNVHMYLRLALAIQVVEVYNGIETDYCE